MDYAFHPVLVAPFYLELMGANVLSLPDDERRGFIAKFRETLPLYTPTDLRYMLRSTWRSEKVAAWVIAALGDRAFLPDLSARFTTRSPMEHVCIALASLGGEGAQDALERYLRTVLPPTAVVDPHNQTVSPEWALAALSLLDAELSTERYKVWCAPGGPWTQYVAAHERFKQAETCHSRQGTAARLLPKAVSLIESQLQL